MGNSYSIPGRPPPHLTHRAAALSLASKVQPVGSVNVVALQAQRHLVNRRKLAAEAAGQALLVNHERTTLDLWDGSRPAWIAQYLGATESIRLIQIKAVVPGWINFGTSLPRRVVVTDEGEMLLPGTTVVVTHD